MKRTLVDEVEGEAGVRVDQISAVERSTPEGQSRVCGDAKPSRHISSLGLHSYPFTQPFHHGFPAPNVLLGSPQPSPQVTEELPARGLINSGSELVAFGLGRVGLAGGWDPRLVPAPASPILGFPPTRCVQPFLPRQKQNILETLCRLTPPPASSFPRCQAPWKSGLRSPFPSRLPP